MKDFNTRFKQVAQPIIDLRQMATRVAQPEASTGMFNGGMVKENQRFSTSVIPYGPLADRAMTLRPQFYYGPDARPDAPSFSKGGMVKGKKKAPKKAPKKTKK